MALAMAEPPKEFDIILGWADTVRSKGKRPLGVRANADTGEDATKARELGAEGIGLCRTEHMFLAPDRLPVVRRMILADTDAEETAALEELRQVQQDDFTEILDAMDGLPVTVRLLDPPLHEFLPSVEELRIKEATTGLDAEEKALLAAAESWSEHNPMIGTRGVRLGVIKPGLYAMQVRALLDAAADLRKQGKNPIVEIMIPLTVTREELHAGPRRGCRPRSTQAFKGLRKKPEITIGTMIETPRAAIRADEIAEEADFFSFGTNDLTQMAFGFSRDDVESRMMPAYLEQGLLKRNPFETIDADGVGELVRIGARLGRQTKPKLKLGVCGEHGGDPESIALFYDAGLDYVSCSPFRVPIARLAAAQAIVGEPPTSERLARREPAGSDRFGPRPQRAGRSGRASAGAGGASRSEHRGASLRAQRAVDMAIADDDIERLRSTVSIVDVVGQYVQLRRVGRNWIGLCPFHAEKSPSFNVREETGRYHCFGCDKSGDVFTFVQEHEHVDFVGAVEMLAARAGIQLTYTSTGQSKERAQRKRLVEAMGTAVEWYHQRLLDDPAARAARDYLRSRGLAGDVARQFKLGWAPDDWDALAKGAGIAPELLRTTGLAFVNRRDRMQDALRARVLFPIFSDNGEAGGHRRAGPARLRRSGQVQELAGDADLRQVQDAVRAELGQGRHRRVRPGRRVRGLHRRHRLPPGRRQAGRGDVRHGVHRGPRPAAQALRQPRRAGLRRRRRRPGRGRALLRVGAAVPGAGRRWPACPAAPTPASWPRRTRRRWPPRSPMPRRSWRSASAGSMGGRPARTPEDRVRLAERAMEVVNEHPDANVRKLYAGQVASEVGLPGRTTSCASPSSARGARPSTVAPVRRTAVRENAEFVAIAVLAQDWESIAEWLVEELFADEAHRRAFLALGAADGNLNAAIEQADPEAREVLERAAVADLDVDADRRGPQPDRRGRPARAAPVAAHRRPRFRAGRRRGPGAPRGAGRSDPGRPGSGVVARLAPSSDGAARPRGTVTSTL